MELFYGDLRQNRERQGCLIYPSDPRKIYWDVLIVLMLLVACTIIPARLAFVDKTDIFWEAIFYTLDFFFFIDIIVMFFSVQEDRKKMLEITDRGTIIVNYLKGWFLIDLISIIPLDLILQ
jgi:hypothetical protein